MQTIRITTPQNIDIDYEIAGLGERVLARLIDGVLMAIIAGLSIIAGIAISDLVDPAVLIVLGVLLAAVFIVFYDLLFETFMNGQSVGKRIMKIKVISLDGGRPSFGQFLLRWLFRIVDFSLTSSLCGLICVAVSDKKQRVGDMVAGTTLIKTTPRTKIDHLVFTPPADDYKPVFAEATQLSDHDITILQEVIKTYFDTGNRDVVYSAAARIRDLLAITPPENMDALTFLQTIVKDYSHIVAVSDQAINS